MSPYQFTPLGRVIIHMAGGDVVVHGQPNRNVANLIAKDVQPLPPPEGSDPQETHLRVTGSCTLTLSEATVLRLQGDMADVVLRNLADIRLSGCRGDLVANELGSLQVDAELRGDVALRQIKGMAGLQAVRGDLAAGHLGALHAAQVKGDVSLVSVSDVQIGVVGGDFRVTHGGSVQAKEIKGDAALSSVIDATMLKKVGGDLSIVSPGASVAATEVSGDFSLRGPLQPAGKYWINTGGDVDARISGNARISLRSGGLVRLGADIQILTEEAGLTTAQLGDAEDAADLNIDARGDVFINSPAQSARRQGASVDSELRQAMDEMQRELQRAAVSVDQSVLPVTDSASVSAAVGASVRSVVRDLLDSLSTKVAPPPPASPPSPPASSPPAPDEIKMIMDMLANGSITVEEAEQLIEALGGAKRA